MAGSKLKGKSAAAEASRVSKLSHIKPLLRKRKRLAHTPARARAIEDADITRELEKLGFTNLTDFLRFGEDGVTLLSSNKISPEKLAALRGITIQTQEYENKKGKKNFKTVLRIDLHDKKSALDSLAKIRGMIKPQKHEHTGEGGGPIQINVGKTYITKEQK